MSLPLRKKVLVIPSWYPSSELPRNGIFVREQAHCLVGQYDVTVLTPRFPSLGDLIRLRWGPELLREDDEGLSTWRIRQIKIPTLRRHLPLMSQANLVLVYYRKFAAAIWRGFATYVKQHGLPDILHAHVVLPAGWVAVDLAKEFGIPVVITEHSEPFAMHLATHQLTRLVAAILSGADRLAAVSPSLRDTMKTVCPEVAIDVTGNLIDTDYFTPVSILKSGSQPFRFFFLGLLLERKGAQYLLQAVRLLRAQGLKDFDVFLGGDGPYRPSLEKMAAEWEIGNHCLFLGNLDRAQVREQMRACDAFVLPSLGETFGIVLGEAMACGKPVLSTRCGGPEYVVTPEVGVLVQTANAQQLADAMASFLTKGYSFVGNQIRESVVRRFGRNAFLEKTGQLYEEAWATHKHVRAA